MNTIEAQFIVTACNSHADLIHALQMVKRLDVAQKEVAGTYIFNEAQRTLIQAALKKAGAK